MRYKPHPYQSRAIAWVVDHPRCLLFLDMGLGKSVITLTAIQRLMQFAEVEKVLVVAPKKVAESTWSSEARKWDHIDLRVSVILGTAAQCRAAMGAEADVYVTSRDRVVWLRNELKGSWPYDMVVLDELTSFKNPRSLRFKALRGVLAKTPRIVGLTGTPTPNGLGDLWAQVHCIDQGKRLGPFVTRYRERWFDLVVRNNITIRMTPKKGAEEEIRSLLSDIALTMRAEDWLQLPPMVEHDVRVALPPAKLEAYRRFERDRVMEAAGRELTAASAAAMVNKLAQFANGAVYDDNGTPVEIHSEKLEALGELLEATDGPVLCFYGYKHDAERITARFARLSPRVYSGSADLDDWNAGRIRLLLAHPASTAFGLNMQKGGHTCVWFTTGWNLELYQQANARLHRQGQARPVIVHRLVATGTVDERMLAALEGKGTQQRGLLKAMAARLIADHQRAEGDTGNDKTK